MINLSIQKAIIFATLKHQEQKRKGTDIPYIVHPVEVMQILTKLECSDNVIIAGLLHDTLEDTNTTAEEIKNAFGEKVLDIVKSESEDKSKTWKERKQATIEHLEKVSTETKLVCFADKLSNIKSIYRDKQEMGEKIFDRFNAPKENLKWYYENLAKVFEKIEENECFNYSKYCNLLSEYLNIVKEVFN